MPLFLGSLIYLNPFNLFIPPNLKNYLPDGLWAFSFTSTILIIWNGNISSFWIILLSICFILFECLQSNLIINGTGDLLDVLIYFLFGLASIFLNVIINKKRI